MYYNDYDSQSVAWLKQLIKNGVIQEGVVDARSVKEVTAEDIIGHDRCHFFAGIGTWEYCLEQAGWGTQPIWTASLPCQPFSNAGKKLGKEDERHLLPHFLGLVRECRPNTIIGEQVESAIAHGWLDDLQTTMEAEGYAVGHCVLGSHSIGAPHKRQRLYWVADRSGKGHKKQQSERTVLQETHGNEPRENVARSGGMVHTDESGSQPRLEAAEAARYRSAFEPASGLEWIYCQDGKYRPIESSIQPMVDGIAKGMVYSGDPSSSADETQEARVIRLKGYGNAIQAQTAIAFIKAYMSI